jgi:hypothetical protein
LGSQTNSRPWAEKRRINLQEARIEPFIRIVRFWPMLPNHVDCDPVSHVLVLPLPGANTGMCALMELAARKDVLADGDSDDGPFAYRDILCSRSDDPLPGNPQPGTFLMCYDMLLKSH